MTEITNPYIYIPDPDQSRALFNAKLYFGLQDTDPTISTNQKLVKGIQEDGIPVSLAQPILTNSGGVPELNGKPLRLDISGNYSFTALSRLDVQKYYAPNVENIESGSDGFSGVVVIENNTLILGQTTVTLATVGANESVFYIHTAIGDQGFLAKDIDYTVTDSTTIELTGSKNAGDIVVARQNDPTGQLVPVNDDAKALLVFSALSDAAASAVAGNLIAGDTVTLNGNSASGDGLGGDKYLVQVTGPANDGVNYLDLNVTLQLSLKNNYYRFQNYSETIATAVSSAGVLNINLNDGASQQTILTENISSLTFVNFNPIATHSSTVTLKVQQDGVGNFGIVWPASIVWSGGTAPTVTLAADSIDLFGFTTYDAGITWFGFSLGADFS
jgi:hypothetical protein